MGLDSPGAINMKFKYMVNVFFLIKFIIYYNIENYLKNLVFSELNINFLMKIPYKMFYFGIK